MGKFKVKTVLFEGKEYEISGIPPHVCSCLETNKVVQKKHLPRPIICLEERRRKDRIYYHKQKGFNEYLEEWSKKSGRSVQALRSLWVRIKHQCKAIGVTDDQNIRFFFEKTLRGYIRDNNKGG